MTYLVGICKLYGIPQVVEDSFTKRKKPSYYRIVVCDTTPLTWVVYICLQATAADSLLQLKHSTLSFRVLSLKATLPFLWNITTKVENLSYMFVFFGFSIEDFFVLSTSPQNNLCMT